jgi:hypothetical protein
MPQKQRLVILLLVFMAVLGFARVMGGGGLSVEEHARLAAEGANIEFSRNPPTDGVTLSTRAYAKGKAVVYEIVLAIRRDVTESELQVWRAGTRGEVVPAACRMLSGDPYFNAGFHFVYRYLDRDENVLDEIPVNRPACEVL